MKQKAWARLTGVWDSRASRVWDSYATLNRFWDRLFCSLELFYWKFEKSWVKLQCLAAEWKWVWFESSEISKNRRFKKWGFLYLQVKHSLDNLDWGFPMESGEPSTQIKHPTDESLINSYDFIHIFCNNNFSSVPFGFLLFISLTIQIPSCEYAFI